MARKFENASDFIEKTRVRSPKISIEEGKEYAKRVNMRWFDSYKEFTNNYTGDNKGLKELWNKVDKRQQLILSGQYQAYRDSVYKEGFKDYLEQSMNDYSADMQKKIQQVVKRLKEMSPEDFSRKYNEELTNIESGKYGSEVKSSDFDLTFMYPTKGKAYGVKDGIREVFMDFLNNITSANPDETYEPDYDKSHRGKELLEDYREDIKITPTSIKQLKRIGAKNIDKYTEDSLNPYDIIAQYARDKISQGKRWKYGLSQNEVDIVNEILARN